MKEVIHLPSGGRLIAHRRVLLSENRLELAGAEAAALGSIELDGFAAADPAPLLPRDRNAHALMTAAGPIDADADVYAAALGMVASTGTVKEGRAITAARYLGDVIEVEWEGARDEALGADTLTRSASEGSSYFLPSPLTPSPSPL